MSKNNTLNTTELMSGKDGRIFVEYEGVMVDIAEASSYTLNMNVNTVEKQPLGSIVVHRVGTGVTYDLVITEMVIRDDLMMEPLLESIKNGWIPVYHFQSVLYKPDGQEQRYALNNVIPNGTFGLQNVTPGEVIEREQSFAVNSVPDLIKSLKSTYIK